MLSLCVFGVSAYGWVTVTKLNNSLTTANVFDSERPADGSIDILLIGMDARTDAQGNKLPKKVAKKLHTGAGDGETNTDTLILVHIPNNGKAATAVSIPRDSYVDVPGFGKHKINSAYQRAKKQEEDRMRREEGQTDSQQLEMQSNQAGARSTIKTVEKLSGVGIDHYAQVNLLGFHDISKAIGGVPVCLKHPVNDPHYSGAKFKKGEQTVEGTQALAFVRQRHNIPGGSTDLQRNRRQQAFLASMAHKVLSAGMLTSPSSMDRLMKAVRKSMVIDQGWDISGFAQQMQHLTGGEMSFSSVPVESMTMRTPSGQMAVKVDPKRVHEFIQNQVGEGKHKHKAKPSAHRKRIKVDVRNGTVSQGLANSVSSALGKKGYTTGGTGNSTSRAQTLVRYAPGGKSAAKQVSSSLGGKFQLEPDNSLQRGMVRVYLGTDYSGPGAESNQNSASADDGAAGSAGSSAGASSGDSSSGNGGPQAKPSAPMPPITADGTTCVD